MTAQVKFQEVAFAPEGPQPLLREIPPGAPYPVEALGPLRPAVEAVAGATQAPVAIPAASALAVASLAVQGHGDVETLGGPRPTSLYLVTVARSGERKTTCDAALLAELRAYEREQAKAHRTAFQSWQNAHALWAGERNRILAEAKAGKGEKRTAAQADLEALGPEPAMPPLPDRTVAEPTSEGLTRLFALGQPSLGLFSDEGGQFLGGFAMNSDNRQKTLAALNDLWQGNPIRRTRAGDGHMTLYGRRLAAHLMVHGAAGGGARLHGRPAGRGHGLPGQVPDQRTALDNRHPACREGPAQPGGAGGLRGAAARNPRGASAHGRGNARAATSLAAAFGRGAGIGDPLCGRGRGGAGPRR
jgi:hypothetical protein